MNEPQRSPTPALARGDSDKMIRTVNLAADRFSASIDDRVAIWVYEGGAGGEVVR